MNKGRLMNRAEDYNKLGINPNKVEAWEDSRRDTSDPGHAEVWYLDCSFDDKSTLVLGFRPKSTGNLQSDTDNSNVAINYSHPGGTPFYDYRLYSNDETKSSKDKVDLKWGPSTFHGNDWKSYDIHIEPEPDQEIVMEGKKSIEHKSKVDLHFEAQTKPFRPGSGYITFGDNDEYYYNFICITKLKVSGKITIDREEKEVSGSAYYNHQWFNISPISAFHHWVWGRQNIGDYSVLLYDMIGADKFDRPRIPLMTIDDNKGGRIFENTASDNVKAEIVDTYTQKQTGKVAPKTLHYTFNKKDVQVDYWIKDPKEINIIDFYGMSPKSAQEQYDKMNLQPTYTRYLATTQLKITRNGKTETIDGSMLYEINFAAKSL